MQEANNPQETFSGDEPWRSPLDELERTLQEVGRALAALRHSLQPSAPLESPQVQDQVTAPQTEVAPTRN